MLDNKYLLLLEEKLIDKKFIGNKWGINDKKSLVNKNKKIFCFASSYES
ncbi:MAG: hypothetical protein BAJALOKI1v1_390019, partial [Promethearchaeota archaeon]